MSARHSDLEEGRIQIGHPRDLDSWGHLASALGIGLTLLDQNLELIWYNELMRQKLPEIAGGPSHTCFAALWKSPRRCSDCLPTLVFSTGEPRVGIRERAQRGSLTEAYRICALPVEDETGRFRWVLESFVNLSSLGPAVVPPRAVSDVLGDAVSMTGGAFIVVDLQHRIVSWSAEARALFGYDLDEALGSSIDLLLPKDRLWEKRLIMERVEREGKLPRMETMRLDRSERLVPVAVSAVAMRDSAGSLIGRSTMIEDLSALHHLRRRLEAQEQMLAHLAQQSSDAILEIGCDGTILNWSSRAGGEFGVDRDTMVGCSLAEFAESSTASRILKKVMRQGKILGERIEWRHSQGRSVPVEMTASLLRDAEGEPLGIVATIRDASAQMRLERRMLRSEKLAATGSLAAGLAHEIGTPLNIISATAEYLLFEGGDIDRRRDELNTIVEETERIGRMVGELLQLARESDAERTSIDLKAAIDKVLRLLRIPLEQKKVDLKIEFSHQRPSVHVEPDGLHQLLLNLLVNALAAVSDEGRIGIMARNEAPDSQSQEAMVCLKLYDDGPGIPKALRERVFDPFFTTREDGTGLGLSVCARIIARHGGDISVGKGPWGGACFVIHLPIQPAEALS